MEQFTNNELIITISKAMIELDKSLHKLDEKIETYAKNQVGFISTQSNFNEKIQSSLDNINNLNENTSYRFQEIHRSLFERKSSNDIVMKNLNILAEHIEKLEEKNKGFFDKFKFKKAKSIKEEMQILEQKSISINDD